MNLDKEKLAQIERIVDEHFDDQWEDGYTRTSRKSADAMALAAYILGAQCIAPEARGITIPFDLWDEIHDFIYAQVDVRDGADGPRPNRAMHLSQRIEAEVSQPQSNEERK